MKSFIENLIAPEPLLVPQNIIESFEKLYPIALNPEWSRNNGNFEVIFYSGEQELIVGFNSSGNLEFSKRNLKIADAPDLIMQMIKDKWELMNILEINQNGAISYECIVRDITLKRYVLYTDSAGNISTQTEL